MIHISRGHISAQVHILGVSCHFFICTFHFTLLFGWPVQLIIKKIKNNVIYIFVLQGHCDERQIYRWYLHKAALKQFNKELNHQKNYFCMNLCFYVFPKKVPKRYKWTDVKHNQLTMAISLFTLWLWRGQYLHPPGGLITVVNTGGSTISILFALLPTAFAQTLWTSICCLFLVENIYTRWG